MSGIVGIVDLGGRPAEGSLVESLTGSLLPLGWPRQTAIDGAAGFGSATPSDGGCAIARSQHAWVVADARIDDRPTLLAALADAGCAPASDAAQTTDAALILAAWEAWGERAPEHLLGDFAFAVWDRSTERLFCARDPLGVKPLYFWQGGTTIVFANALDVLRRHPAVPSEPNELAIADYLLFGQDLDPERTPFLDLFRLPPAHARTWSVTGSRHRRYWQLALETGAGPAGSSDDWVGSFGQALDRAVRDRTREGSAAVLMSGGLDSTAVAALAHRAGVRLDACTGVYEQLIDDPEGAWARSAATAIGIPIRFTALDGYTLGERWGELPVPPQPGDHFLDAIEQDMRSMAAQRHQVALTGHGGDIVLLPFRGYFLQSLRQLRIDRAAGYVLGQTWRRRRLPPLGLHSAWQRRQRRRRWRNGFPAWLAPRLVRDLDLEARWRWYRCGRPPAPLHPAHPEAHRALLETDVPNYFERHHPGAHGVALELRHPFFDLRVVAAVMRTPPVPWCLDKRLLREATRGILPDALRRRPKTPLNGNPKHSASQPVSALWRVALERQHQILERFVRPDRVLAEIEHHEAQGRTGRLDQTVRRPVNLAYWLERTMPDGLLKPLVACA